MYGTPFEPYKNAKADSYFASEKQHIRKDSSALNVQRDTIIHNDMNAPLQVSVTQQQHVSALGCKIHQQGKLYYSLNMARNVIDDWERDLKPRIDDHLNGLYSGGDSSTQFILASRHHDENRMTPSVVILCLSKRQKKVILNSFKGGDWDERFREMKVKLRVIIDTEFGEKAGTDRRWALPRLSGPNPEIF